MVKRHTNFKPTNFLDLTANNKVFVKQQFWVSNESIQANVSKPWLKLTCLENKNECELKKLFNMSEPF